ncbi:MAG: hypothetical protein VB039_04510 [Oscillospiraceae bacterium]|nr:hypothetical protein [Oscillospiraceae bacterium]
MGLNPFFLVKVTDKKWADKFQDGQVYMRALSCFGDLSRREADSNNTFRGDVLEGFSESFENGHNPHAFIKTPSGRVEIVPNQVGLIDVLLLREKVFCLYSLEYDLQKGGFINPDMKMRDFGDTAVIITNPFAFIQRFCLKIIEKYDYDFWTSAKRVSYDINLENEQYYDEYHKSPAYSWQKEFRLVLDLAKGKFDAATLENVTDFAKMTFLGKIELDTNPDSIADSLTLDIGDIHDISVSIPIMDFCDEYCNKHLPVPEPFEELDIPRPNYPTFFRLVAKCSE